MNCITFFIGLFFFETIIQHFHPYRSPYFLLLFHKNFFLFLKLNAVVLCRCLSAYIMLGALAEALSYPILKSVPWLKRGSRRFFVLCLIYVAWMGFIFQVHPAAKATYEVSFRLLFVVLISLFCVDFMKNKNTYPLCGFKSLFLVFFMSLMVLLGLTPHFSEKSQGRAFENTNKLISKKPSFLLLSFDGVPKSIFDSTEKELMPLKNSSMIEFKNAYSLSNSTFTSWFSILSGLTPRHSGVETLYPYHREGKVNLKDLLPRVLKNNGYSTVFMTDCASTSYMKEAYGFSELYQIDQGLYGCVRAQIESTHPLNYVFGLHGGANFFFPELDTFCSPLYRPEYFFSEVKRKLNLIKEPFFVAVHSCLTHRDVVNHLPPQRELIRSSYKNEWEKLSVIANRGKQLIHPILKAMGEKKGSYTFFFSDHGVRIDKDGDQLKYFSHALGYPVNRFQYHVPLYILSNELKTHYQEKLVGLIDIFPTVLELAGLPAMPVDGYSLWGKLPQKRSLVLTSSLPLIEPKDHSPDVWKELVISEPNGEPYFPKSYDAFIREKKVVSIVSLPHRLVMAKSPQLYNELRDPYHTKNIHDLLVIQNLTKQLEKSERTFVALK